MGEYKEKKEWNKIRKGVMNTYICSPIKQKKFYKKQGKRNKNKTCKRQKIYYLCAPLKREKKF